MAILYWVSWHNYRNNTFWDASGIVVAIYCPRYDNNKP